MPGFSYVQTDFRGGLWSASAQGRMDLPIYRTALNECLNSLPQEDGSWTRRPGFRYIAHTRAGQAGRLIPFRFERSQAYQAELTPLKLRFVVGLTLLRDEPDAPIVVNINRSTPAKVRTSSIPGWVNGDTVMFNITSDPPSSYNLYGRQFVIQNINNTTKTFDLYDPVTGAPVSGAEIAWFNLGGGSDSVQRVLEYVTPYTAADIPNVRIVQDAKNTVLFFCPGWPPYALVVSGATQFTFGEADFQDGPYLDENELVTTLTLSGLSGSVTVTASSTAGINEGAGFQTTDVGRLIWFQGGPAAWSNAVPYAKEAKVLGSDGNIYRSLISNNLNNNPISDTGSKWEITSDTVSITWLEITARMSTTSVTALIRGAATTSGTATTHWRLGVYSYTTGFPTCGAYHEARLVMAGAVKNRFDMSMNFKSLTFSPTEVDGTVSDDNSVAGILNNRDAELISAMLSVDEGLFIGTLSGEWMLKASALDDPISPTSAQARNPATAGVANIEVLHIYGMPTYVQSRQRKIQTHRRVEGKFESVNHNKFAQGLTSPRIVETAWCQEPMISFFCRMSDGKLTGAIHKVSQLDESFTGWHRHEHAMGRTFEALSSGPNFSGVSDSLFVITAHPSNPTAPRWIETMMPTQSEGDPAWVAWHTDGSGTGFYIRRMISANGDAYDGLKIYGLWHLNGEVVHPFIGGLDLGDFTVALGSIDLPYSGAFTAAFLAAINDGTDYSDWGVQLQWADAPVTTNPLYPLNSIAVMDNTITSTVSGTEFMWDRDTEEYYRVDPLGNPQSIRVFDALNGDLLREAVNYNAIFPSNDVGGLIANTVPTRCLVGPETGSRAGGSILSLVTLVASVIPPASESTYHLALIDRTTLVKYHHWNTAPVGGGTDTHPPESVAAFPFQYLDPVLLTVAYNNFAACSMSGNDGRVNIYCLSSIGPLGTIFGRSSTGGLPMALYTDIGTHDFHRFFRGYETIGLTTYYSFAPIGNVSSTSFSRATSAVVREWTTGFANAGSGLAVGTAHENIFNIAALAVDPTWVQGFGDFSLTYDAAAGNFFMLASGFGFGWRAAKFDRLGNILWNVSLAAGVVHPPTQQSGPWNANRWAYMASTGVIYEINLTTGAVSTFTGQATGFTTLLDNGGEYDEFGPSVFTRAAFDPATGSPSPTPNLIGSFANANPAGWTSNYARIWLGTSFTQDQLHREINAEYYFNPTNFGVSFTSRGQLLRPDYGQDAGAALGPAFGKKRRNHMWAASFVNAFNVKIGTDFSKLKLIKFKTAGGTPLAAPTLFSGVASDTIDDDYSYEGKLAWEVTRQYSCTITAIGGFIATQDK